MVTDRGVAFRSRLRHALQTCVSDSGEPYSYRELAAAIRAKGYDGPSAAYLNQLATGVRSDPKLSYVQAIAAGLGLPVSYFLEDVDGEHTVRPTPPGVELMAMRAGELSERGRRQVMEVLDLVYRLERGESATRDGD